MELVLTLLGWLTALVFVLVVLGFILPSRQHVERSADIKAPPQTVFGLVGDFHEWQHWSPWADRDPDMQMQITGAGQGQIMAWQSQKPNVGNGVQTMTDYQPNDHIVTALDFGGKGRASARFQLEPQGDGHTKVIWSMDTDMREGVPFMMKPMATYMGFMMDKWVGADYELGLGRLKKAAEARG